MTAPVGRPRLRSAETLRLFCALRLPADTVAGVADWQERALSGGRIVPAANLHLTLAFLGARPVSAVPAIAGALAAASAFSPPVRLRLARYRETRSVGMLVFDDEAGAAAGLAERLAAALEALGLYRREKRPFAPHLTVLRFADPPRLTPPLPDLGVVCPSDAAVYSSTLRPDGARYDVLEATPLGG